MPDIPEEARPFRVLVTGSRTWDQPLIVWGALKEIVDEHGRDRVVIVHGDCPTGADKAADGYARNYRLQVERHPADWNGPAKRGAGFARNAEMVRLGADVCLAFVDPCTLKTCPDLEPHGSHGASHTADLAERAGIYTRRFPEADRV